MSVISRDTGQVRNRAPINTDEANTHSEKKRIDAVLSTSSVCDSSRVDEFTCQKIFDMNKPSFSEKEPFPPGSPQGDAHKFIVRQQALLRQSKLYDRGVCFSFLENVLDATFQNPYYLESIIDERTCRDLNLVCGSHSQPQSYFGGEISKHISTQMGVSYLMTTLTHPTSNIDVLEKRQEVIKFLAEKDNLISKAIQESLRSMKGESEAELLSFWKRIQLPGCLASMYSRSFQPSFNDSLNVSPLFLSSKAVYTNAKKALGIATKALLIPFGTITALNALGVINDSIGVNHYTRHFAGNLNEYAGWAFFISEDSNTVQFMTAAAATGLALSTFKGSYDWFLADIKAGNIVQNKLVAVAKHYRGMKDIYLHCKSNKELRENLEHFNLLDKFFSNKDLFPLFRALEAGTFDYDSSIYNTGNVLVAWNLLQDTKVKKQYEEALVALAEIDTLMGTANLLVKDDGLYCLTDFIEGSDQPKVELKGFWNPQVVQDDAVVSDLTLNFEKECKNIVVTGRNGIGKSTVLRSVLDAAILSQTLGIAPATSANITPFSIIRSSMTAADDAGMGVSRFQSEADNIADIEKVLNSLPEDKFSLVAFDEIFKSTHKGAGDNLSTQVVSRLGTKKNVVLMAASNEKVLTELEDNGESFKNFQVNEDRVLIPGIYADDDAALEVARSRGVNVT